MTNRHQPSTSGRGLCLPHRILSQKPYLTQVTGIRDTLLEDAYLLAIRPEGSPYQSSRRAAFAFAAFAITARRRRRFADPLVAAVVSLSASQSYTSCCGGVSLFKFFHTIYLNEEEEYYKNQEGPRHQGLQEG